MKKFLSVILVMALYLSIFPTNTAYGAVKISKTKATLEVDATLTLKATGTESSVKWASSKKEIAKVSSKGTVTALKEGTAIITATIDSKKYTCEVFVVNSKSTSIAVGETVEFTSGEYIVGEDLSAGTYTLEITDGYGGFYSYKSENEFDKDGYDYKNMWMSASNEKEKIYKNFKFSKGNYVVISAGMIVELKRTK